MRKRRFSAPSHPTRQWSSGNLQGSITIPPRQPQRLHSNSAPEAPEVAEPFRPGNLRDYMAIPRRQPRRLHSQPRTHMSPYTKGVAVSKAMLVFLHFSSGTSRLDFAKFHLKRVNRPTSEAQPQKKRGNRKQKPAILEGG